MNNLKKVNDMYSFLRLSCIKIESTKKTIIKMTVILISCLIVFSGFKIFNPDAYVYAKSKDESQDSKLEAQRKELKDYFGDLHGFAVGNPETGEIYFADKTDKKVPIASITKLMTYLLVMEAMDRGEIEKNGDVIISKEAEDITYPYGIIWLKEGMKVPIDDLIKAMLIPSSNESAVALACHVAGSEGEFVKLMNKRAKELGLNKTHFYTASGLPTNLDEETPEDALPSEYLKTENHSTVEDLFKLASFIMKKYPHITKITSKKDISLQQFSFYSENTNSLLKKDSRINGLKTGYTGGAGRCIICTRIEKTDFKQARKNGKTMVVFMGGKSVEERDKKVTTLLGIGENFFKAKEKIGFLPTMSVKIPENKAELSPEEKKQENKKSLIIKIVEFVACILVAFILLILLLRFIIRRRRRNSRLIMSKKRYRKRSDIKF